LSGPAGPLVQATAVWAAISRPDGRPVPLSPGFLAIYGESAGGRVVSARLSHPRPDAGGNEAASPSPPSAWPLRAADFGTAGHVNNTVHWAVVEDELAAAGWVPATAEIEYQRAIEPGCQPELTTSRREGETLLWLRADGRLLASARLTR
jgi:acyl-ACP thioesterase